ncbi:MAG: MraY family glycosyltransferase [Ancrocorticia sp.]|uniref:MraY family glycosyltransferase n=1 Tax=Ancrocorticia sp. TaxID=2593684 RepID=UPI003F93E417
MRVYLLIMVLAAAITYLMVPVIRRMALAVGAVTGVRARDIHTVPIPRLGGIAMYCGLLVALLVASQIPYLHWVFASGSGVWGVLIGAGIMCLVGAIDDIWQLDWYAKLAGQVLAAGAMAWQGVQLASVPFMGLTVGSSRLSLFVTVMVVIVVANAVNFMDGLDGLAAGIVGIAGSAFFAYSYFLARDASPDNYAAVSSVVVAALVGICVGFLPHNFHPASIFMGDSGALMLGMVIAGAGILVTGQIDPANTSVGDSFPAYMPILVPAAVILLPLIDFVWAVVRRLARGQSPFHADAGHLHHRLLRRGHSHQGAVLTLYLWAAIASLTCVALVILPGKYVIPVSAVAVVMAIVVTRRALKWHKGERIKADDDTRIPDENVVGDD